MYGRRLIQTEKVDAVFGNPERAKGGTHWVIVGSAAILLVWLYYSWDIAKGFYPKSANELCQVAKINESLLGLKYQFPIEEREFKSTSIIKIENKNLQKITNEIKNSNDLINQQKVEDIMKSLQSDFLDSDVIPISAKKEFNLEKVLETIKSNLQESPPFYDKTWFTDRSERYLVEEIIRNKILDNFQKEIPYSVNIQVEEFIEDNGLIRIRANIYVLRDSQRAILIGHKGSKLRKIGAQSRVEIEKLFNKKVFLETPIKISKNWRDDEKKLKKFGYQ